MKKLLLAGATAFALGLGAAAEATTIVNVNPGNFGACDGLAVCNVGGANLTATGTAIPEFPLNFGSATFDIQNFRGDSGLGIRFQNSGRAGDPEIQPGETLDASFASGVVTTLRFIFLYNPEEFGVNGDPVEIAIVGSTPALAGQPYTLTVTGNDPGEFAWTGLGTVTRDSTFLGLWTITNPFGDANVTGLSLTSPATQVSGSGDRSEFALYELTVVPEPASLALLGAGLVGLGVVARRRRKV